MNRRDLLRRGIRLAAAAPVVAMLGPSAFATPPAPKQDEWTRMGGKFVLGFDVGNGESFAVLYHLRHTGVRYTIRLHSEDGGVTWKTDARREPDEPSA